MNTGPTLQQLHAWRGGIAEELQFWRHWLDTCGAQWSDDYAKRFNPQNPLDSVAQDVISAAQLDSASILDVGAGPVTVLGYQMPGVQIKISAVDPLAHGYQRLLADRNRIPVIKTEFALAEFAASLRAFLTGLVAVSHNKLLITIAAYLIESQITLAERAAKGTKVEGALKDLAGVTSIAYTEGDPVALAKALSKYAKDNPEFTFKAGVVEGRVISVKEIDALASMPSKEEIYSKLLFLINAPAQRLVTVMNAVGRDLAVVINQGVEKQKFANNAPAGA